MQSSAPSGTGDEAAAPTSAEGATTVGFEPAAALRRGRGDAAALVGCWLVRRSFLWMCFLGIAIGGVITRLTDHTSRFDLDASSPGAVVAGIVTPFSLVFLGVVLRIATTWVGLGLAYPLATEYQRRASAGGQVPVVATAFDRLLVARAFRALRLTRDVRLAAFDRLGSTGARLVRVDRAIGIANVATGVLCAVVIAVLGATITV